MERILCIVGSMNAGGAETFLMKIYRNIDRTKYQMDFCVAITEPGVYDEEIRSLGGRILYTVPKSKGFIKSFMRIREIVADNKYNYVMRVSQHSLSGLELIAAKLGGAKTTIFRSSNTQTGGSRINKILHKVCIPITKYIPEIKIAPSTEAAEFMFGKGSVLNKSAKIIPNGLDVEQYKFNLENRIKHRREFGIEENTLVFGHIGRFSMQKNHKFLIEIFAKIHEINPQSVLLLVGKGELESNVRKDVEQLGLTNKVIFAGVRKDVTELLSAMDIFLFPSFFEGMPNTVIEAQTSGLPCLISDTITKEVAITDLVNFLELDENPEQWARKAVELKVDEVSRRQKANDVRLSGYDVKNSADLFIKTVFE